MIVAPSLLSADFLELETEIEFLNSSADIIHLDVMDGSFVPNISFGFSVIDAIKNVATIPMDAHLMVVNPQDWFDRLAADKVSMISFHLEAAKEKTGEYIDRIHALGLKAGVAVNPDIPVEGLFDYIGKADYFLIMMVYAGFGGQKLIPQTLEKIKILKAELNRRGFDTPIQADGGVTLDNCNVVSESGVDICVAGSAVYKAADKSQAIAIIRQA